MKNTFSEFCSKIEKLEEHESGKLKGGFSSISLHSVAPPANNGKSCTCNKDCEGGFETI